MPSRFLLIIVFCISLCVAAIASAQNGRFRSRRYSPPNYFAAPVARGPQLTSEQMDRIYGPSILVRRHQKQPGPPAKSFVVQPR